MQYTAEFKSEVLESYKTLGTSETARRFDVARSSIINWAHEAGIAGQPVDQKALEAAADRREIKRAEARETLLDIVLTLQDRLLSPGKAGDARDLAVALGIIYDKYRLEVGEHTARTYHEGPDDIDRAVSQLVEELRRTDQTSA